MTGPYAWVPPNYYYEAADTIPIDDGSDGLGGAWGFNTETSTGASILTMDSLQKTVPADKLWPISEYWEYHTGNIASHAYSLENCEPRPPLVPLLVSLSAIPARRFPGAQRTVRPVFVGGGVRRQVAGLGARVASRHVRGLRSQQVHRDRCHPVDARQRLAEPHVASDGLL